MTTKIFNCVANMDEESIEEAIDDAFDQGATFEEIYTHDLTGGMLEVTRLFEENSTLYLKLLPVRIP